MDHDAEGTSDWLGACRQATDALREVLAGGGEAGAYERRSQVTGSRGQGGDATLVMDADAEAAIFSELDALRAGGLAFSAVSEERGEVDYGARFPLVVIDPIDGSTNAKRGLPHHSVSIAVAEGPTMADVVFGYVFDFGPGEEFTAIRGGGAFLDGKPLATDRPERTGEDGRLELLGIESADPRNLRDAADELVDVAHRLRALGTIAVTLCQVAAARLDGMVTLRRSRAVDAAAGQLIVREAGGVVAFTAYEDPLGAPLDTAPRSPLVAARTPAGLDRLRGVPLT